MLEPSPVGCFQLSTLKSVFAFPGGPVEVAAVRVDGEEREGSWQVSRQRNQKL